jgi:hypothetical protein
MAGPFADATDVSDLEEGDEVHVFRDDGEAADRICLVPEGPPELDQIVSIICAPSSRPRGTYR